MPTNTFVAIKALEWVEEELEEIETEINVLSKCKSPHIVDFFGAFYKSEKVWVRNQAWPRV